MMDFFHQTKIILFNSFKQWQVNILSNVVVGATHSITQGHLRKQFLLLSLIVNQLGLFLGPLRVVELSSHDGISCGYKDRLEQVHTRFN